ATSLSRLDLDEGTDGRDQAAGLRVVVAGNRVANPPKSQWAKAFPLSPGSADDAAALGDLQLCRLCCFACGHNYADPSRAVPALAASASLSRRGGHNAGAGTALPRE